LNDLRVEQRTAGRHRSDCPAQQARVANPVLEEVGATRCPILEEPDRIVGVVELAEDHHRRSRCAFTDLARRSYTFVLERGRHPDVGDHDLRVQLGGPAHELVVVASDSDDVEIVVAGEQRAYALADDQVVVGEHERDGIPHAVH
jgi:hypothetical protein